MLTQAEISSEWMGLTDYSESLAQQFAVADSIRNQKRAHILGLEHPAVVTLGKRARADSDLPWGTDLLKEKNIALFVTDRGGQATLHSPGQLVIYPLVCLPEWGLGVREFVEILERSTQKSLRRIGIESENNPQDPGVYTSQGKISFCGIRVDRGVSRHGISINISNDLGLFSLIRSCGAMSRPLDKIESHVSVEVKAFFEIWVAEFSVEMAGRRNVGI